MPNILRADCGFDPADVQVFEDATVELLNDPSGLDLQGHRNMYVSLAAESGNVTINEIEHMRQGVDYTIVATNGATTKNQLIFPDDTLYSGEDIVAVNNMTVVYKFFTDGKSIYCDRRIYK